MKVRRTPAFADPEVAARKLVEIANGIEAAQEAQFCWDWKPVWAAEDINGAQQDSSDHEAADCVESANRHLLITYSFTQPAILASLNSLR
jgi:hypothetical protein